MDLSKFDCLPPETGDMQETDTADFFPQTPLPTTAVGTEAMESLDQTETAVEETAHHVVSGHCVTAMSRHKGADQGVGGKN